MTRVSVLSRSNNELGNPMLHRRSNSLDRSGGSVFRITSDYTWRSELQDREHNQLNQTIGGISLYEIFSTHYVADFGIVRALGPHCS